MGYQLVIQTPRQAIIFLLLAPLLEEWVFRAQLQQFLSERFGQRSALWLASGVFAAAHAPWMGLWAAGVFLPGLALGLCWQRYQQLWRNLLWHSLFNGSLAFMTFLSS